MIKAIIGSMMGSLILFGAVGYFIYKKYGDRISNILEKLEKIEGLLNKFL